MRVVFYLFLSFFPPRFKLISHKQLLLLAEQHEFIHIYFIHPALYLVYVILNKLQRFKIFRILRLKLIELSSWIARVEGCLKTTVVIEK